MNDNSVLACIEYSKSQGLAAALDDEALNEYRAALRASYLAGVTAGLNKAATIADKNTEPMGNRQYEFSAEMIAADIRALSPESVGSEAGGKRE